MAVNIANFITSTLRGQIGPSTSVLPVTPGTGSRFNIPAGDHMYITITDRGYNEIVKFTSTGLPYGDDIPVQRGQDGTYARSFPAGSCVRVLWNEAQLSEYIQLIIAGTAVSTSNNGCGTQVLTVAPTVAPPSGVCYTVNRTTGALYYWDTGITIPAWVTVSAGTIGGSGSFTIGTAVLTDNTSPVGFGGCEMLGLSNKGFSVFHEGDPNCIHYGHTTYVNRTTGANNNKLVVGHQLVALSSSTQTAPTFGLATEAWVAGKDSACVAVETATIVTSSSRDVPSVGLDSVFKNRPDTLAGGAVAAGLGNNQYNRYSRALQISAQARSTAGEYCGWSRGIEFFAGSLDRTVDGLAVGIDMSAIAIAGQQARLLAAIRLGDGLPIVWENSGVINTQYNAGVFSLNNSADGVNPLRFGVNTTTGVIRLNGITGSLDPLVAPIAALSVVGQMPIDIKGVRYFIDLKQ